jgi:serine/threonine protein kinase
MQQTELQPALPLLAPLARSKTVVKKTEHSSGIVDRTTQPTEVNGRLNQNAQLVSFIRITKHQPSRKNMKQQLIFCQNEIGEDYKFSKYLEQDRYNRLFNEKELLGEGGFGKVYKVEHVLDQRMYAIKQIQIHLGINEDFKKHSVYREIVAISQVQHKNVVRYHACWIESVAPDMKVVNKAVRKLEQSMKQKLKEGKNMKKEESNSEESKLEVDRSIS